MPGSARLWGWVWIGWLLVGTGCVDLGTGLPPDATSEVEEADAAGETGADTRPDRSDTATPEETVQMQGIQFIPETLTVAPGTRVVWEHADASTPHTIKSGTPEAPTEAWESPQLEGGGSWGRIFEEPGTHEYYCTQHPQAMQGTIEVVP